MAQAERSLQELQRATEQTRAGLTDTVEQLKTSLTDTATEIRHRISPHAIKAEVSDYVRTRGEQVWEGVAAAARRNPMQAVAVGASVAYPLFRLARAIPAPILMIGAGLFFAGSKTGQTVTQKASDIASDLTGEMVRRSHDLSEQVGASVKSARQQVSDTASRVSDAVSSGADQVRRAVAPAGADLSASRRANGAAGSLDDATGSWQAGTKEGASQLTDAAINRLRDVASNMTSGATESARSASEAGLQAAQDVRDGASDLSRRAGKTLVDAIQENPILVAGVGLLIGGLIASALPKSDLEENLVGGAASDAKRRAAELASESFDAAKDAAEEIFGNVARQAGAEGLTPGKLDESAREIGQRIKHVAESTVTTAFDPDRTPQSDTTDGGSHHG